MTTHCEEPLAPTVARLVVRGLVEAGWGKVDVRMRSAAPDDNVFGEGGCGVVVGSHSRPSEVAHQTSVQEGL